MMTVRRKNKRQKSEKQQLIDWLTCNDRYMLYSDYDDDNIKKLRLLKQTVQEINDILNEAASKLKRLERRRLGIGDTATDEEISSTFYDIFHWGDKV